MLKSWVLLGALLATPLGSAVAQRSADQQAVVFKPGTRVRLLTTGMGTDPIVGTVTLTKLDTIVIDTADVWRQRRLLMPGPVIPDEFRRIRLPLSAVDSVQVSRGRSRLLGMAMGALRGGVVAGLYVGLKALSRQRSPDAGDFATGFGAGAMIGAGVGLPVGYLLAHERWDSVPVPRRLRTQ